MKRELSVGQKIRFSGPLSSTSGFFENQVCTIVEISDYKIRVKCETNPIIPGWIHRKQVTAVFVKKKKESKYPKEVWINFYTGIDCYLGGRTAFETKDQADRLLGNREIGKAIRYVLAKGQ